MKGKYRHDKEVFIFPRPFIRPSDDKDGNLHKLEELSSSQKKSKLAEGKLGGYIVTPFETDDGRSILVNRGYVSLDYLPAERRPGGQLDYEHTISGILRETESDSVQIDFEPMVGDVDTKFACIQKRNTTALAKYTNSLPIYIDLDREGKVDIGNYFNHFGDFSTHSFNHSKRHIRKGQLVANANSRYLTIMLLI